MSTRRGARSLGAVVGVAALLALAGCSSWTDEPEPTRGGETSEAPTASADPSSSPSESPSATSTPVQTAVASEGVCAEESILHALPQGSEVATFQCALGSPYMWAAAEVVGGSEVYFMRSNGPWEIVEVTVACGDGDDRAPDELATLCPQ
ncbi:hypothetical protein [Demequina sp. NBRC 110056]|uniref:hypothetical protein n=1 Tax=Demequina sp. NBRC 110056 TaxID=1570345 RepID=UPI0009FCC621|nr:hypothetical protein [Demequina sp. NBRC 110056]